MVVLHLFRKAVVALVAVGAIGVVGAGSASAASWHVGGSELVGSAGLAESTAVTEGFVMTFTSLGVEIECDGLQAKEASITAANAGKAGALVFKQCKAIAGVCSLEGTEIKTKPLNIAASTLGAGEVHLKLQPEKAAFLSLTLTGTGCSISGIHTIQGKANVFLAAGQEERAEQELVVNTGSVGELEPEFTLKGKAKLKLQSGASWSFH